MQIVYKDHLLGLKECPIFLIILTRLRETEGLGFDSEEAFIP
jgi:hypothetical protein